MKNPMVSLFAICISKRNLRLHGDRRINYYNFHGHLHSQNILRPKSISVMQNHIFTFFFFFFFFFFTYLFKNVVVSDEPQMHFFLIVHVLLDCIILFIDILLYNSIY